ncbi:MAG: 7-carboxy-7-deazaguanine synthase QueE [Cyanobacteria bacterium P01_H01_bin.121]
MSQTAVQDQSPGQAKPQPFSDLQQLPIVETFHSIQGEGYWAGASAFFIRLAGCDVGCPWCDTKQSWPVERHPIKQINELVIAAKAAAPGIVVITGGEPLMHDLTLLTQQLQTAGLQVHLETSGAYPLSGSFAWITLSPKRSKPPHPELYTQADELKIIVADREDLAWAEQQAAVVPNTTLKLLQPEWQTPASQQLVIDYVKAHPNWRLSLQTHKFLGVR